MAVKCWADSVMLSAEVSADDDDAQLRMNACREYCPDQQRQLHLRRRTIASSQDESVMRWLSAHSERTHLR